MGSGARQSFLEDAPSEKWSSFDYRFTVQCHSLTKTAFLGMSDVSQAVAGSLKPDFSIHTEKHSDSAALVAQDRSDHTWRCMNTSKTILEGAPHANRRW